MTLGGRGSVLKANAMKIKGMSVENWSQNLAGPGECTRVSGIRPRAFYRNHDWGKRTRRNGVIIARAGKKVAPVR